jgi:glucose-1-phosphate thymidylyltransferase
MKAFVLAGGFATRLWPLTEKRAKPLLPLAGKPIITHLVESIPADVHVTVSTNAMFAKGFQEWLQELDRERTELVVEGTRSDDQKLGALGSIAQWVEHEHIEEDVLILTGDNYLGFPLSRFLEAYRGTALLAAHEIGDLERAKAFGTVLVDPNDPRRVIGFEEKPASPKSTLVSTGCVLLPKAALAVLKEFAKVKPDNLGGIFEELIRRGIGVDCFTFTEPWLTIWRAWARVTANPER